MIYTTQLSSDGRAFDCRGFYINYITYSSYRLVTGSIPVAENYPYYIIFYNMIIFKYNIDLKIIIDIF